MEGHGGTNVGPELLGFPVVAHHDRPILYPLPPYPTSHLPQSPAIPTLSSRLHTKPFNFRSMKRTINKAIEFGPMCTLGRSWSLFNEFACPCFWEGCQRKQRHAMTIGQRQPFLLRAATLATRAAGGTTIQEHAWTKRPWYCPLQ